MIADDLSEADFDRVRRLLDDAAGLATDGSRRAALASVIRDLRAAAGGLGTAAYLDLVESDPVERQRLLEASVIGETHWLRTPPQIEALATTVLPRLLETRAGRPVTMWSAGCSTGDEAWSLALLASEAGAGVGDVRILGTDVSARALAAAASGRYVERSLSALTAAQRQRHLTQVTADPPTYQVAPALRELVELRRHDLVHDPLPFAPGSVDVLLCRNVMIYFSRERTRELVERLAGVLRPGGVLVLGHSETLWQLTDAFVVERIGDAFLYRRAGFPPPAWSPQTPVGTVRRPVAAVRPPRVDPTVAPVPRPRPRPAVATDVRAMLMTGDHAAAERQARGRLAQDGLSAEAHYLLGLVLATTGRDSEAVVALRRATYLDPDHGLAHFLLATSLSVLGSEGAQAAYGAAATALMSSRAEEPAPRELEGRSVAEIAALCRTLAALDRSAVR